MTGSAGWTFGPEDVIRGERVKWLAAEQAAGRGTVILCGMCGGDGSDPEDHSDDCPRCRSAGAVLAETVAQDAGQSP